MWRGASAARTKLILRLVAATFIVVTVLMVEAKAQSDLENQTELTAPLEPLRPGVTESQLFAELDAHNELRKSGLHDYTARRTYQVVDLKGKVHAQGDRADGTPRTGQENIRRHIGIGIGDRSSNGAESAYLQRGRGRSRQRAS